MSTSKSINSFRNRKWFIDFSKKSDKQVAISNSDNPAPVGYTLASIPEQPISEEGNRLIGMRAWDIALAPLKQAPMNVFISWMVGNTIGLFTIIYVVMAFVKPFQSLFSASKAFESLDGEYSFLHKFVYQIGNLVGILIALYKCHSMGMLPTYASDWLAFELPQIQLEYASGGFILN